MTLEDFNNIIDRYGLYKINQFDVSGYFEKYTRGDEPVVTFYKGTGQLKIYIDLGSSGNMIGCYHGLYNRPHVIVSEVNTANYFLKELFKQRKKILVDNKLKEINRDFT